MELKAGSLKPYIAALVARAAQEAQGQGLLPPTPLPEIPVEHPQHPENGDYATSLPLRLARAAATSPLPLAEAILRFIPPTPHFQRVWAAPPGFINFLLHPQWLTAQVEAILGQGESYGSLNLGQGERVQIEFVSVNPTGPLHVGHGRGAVLGSTLTQVLSSAGYQTQKEYYINDAGSQMETFYRSLYARYLQALGQEAEMPTEGYLGAYLMEMGQQLASEYGQRFASLPPETAIAGLGKIGLERMLASIKEDLHRLGVEFDHWFSEASLFSGGQYEKALEKLRQGGFIEDREGARWFTSTALGESKDNVLVRTSGLPTYFASDIAYHYNKFLERGFSRVINIWGADHQGHISRMKAAVGALGVEPERLRILISQMVTLKRGEEVVKVSKRSGELITLREVMEEVGPDVCRFFFLTRSPDSQMDFDLELAKKQSEDNPVYYVQYAHTRLAGILRHARERGASYEGGEVSRLGAEPELALIRRLILLPEVVETVATALEPHHLPYYALELATAFHSFYKQCRVVSRDLALSRARLKLVKATQLALSKTLGLMGVNAPETM